MFNSIRNRSTHGLYALAVMLFTLVAFVGTSRAATPSCSLYASPHGSDNSDGSLQSPFRTPQKLIDSLSAGQTGCLRSGTYSQSEVRFGHGGSAGAPLTLTSYPGERATLSGGFVYVVHGSNYVTVSNLRLDTADAGQQPGVQLMAAHSSLVSDNITNHSARQQCVILGSNVGWGEADDTVIKDNVIHQCGSPVDGDLDHAIYFDHSVRATVSGNVIWGAAAFAIHLYQNAQGNRITHNVIADNGDGVIFAGSDTHRSDNNLVADNIIADARHGYDVESYWGGAVGSGNELRHNCLYGGALGEIDTPRTGFSASGNMNANPMFVDPAAHDYALRADSPCLPVVGPDTAAGVAGDPVASAARRARHTHRHSHASARRRPRRHHRSARKQRSSVTPGVPEKPQKASGAEHRSTTRG